MTQEHKCEEDIYGDCYTCGRSMIEDTTNQFEEIDREFDEEFLDTEVRLEGDHYSTDGKVLKNFLHTSITKALREQAEQMLEKMPKEGKRHPNELFFMGECIHCHIPVNDEFVTAKITEVRDDCLSECKEVVKKFI